MLDRVRLEKCTKIFDFIFFVKALCLLQMKNYDVFVAFSIFIYPKH